jgi:glycosyltransferase involved in cell wall biosynthesis
MMNQTPKIVVITPVKNEAWILDRFLAVTSQFADCIIIADQNSTDASPMICKNYPKVILIQNESEQFNEAERQILLIQKARELVPEHKILLALDADEILAASATKTLGWQSMLKTRPGTVLCFEKPDLYLTPNQCVRHDISWPIGYVDDGIEHKPTQIHSIRIPVPDYGHRLYIHDVKIVHYSMIRPGNQASKFRFYSVVENILSTGFVLTRRKKYDSNKLFMGYSKLQLSPSPSEWFTAWEELGIDMKTTINQKYSWQDFEVLKYFHKYGVRRFWLDDIWGFDWEACRLYAKSIGMTDIPDRKISGPPKIIGLIASALTDWYIHLRKFVKGNSNLWS